MIVFESSKVLLEPLNEDEWVNYLVHLNMSNEHYFQYGYEDKEELFELIQTPVEVGIYYTIKKAGTDEMVGYVAITPELEGNPYNNLEFYIFQEYRREGYAYEAILVMLDEYFSGSLTEKIPCEVIAEALIENKLSIALLEKLGFAREALGVSVSLDENNHLSSHRGLRRYVLKYEDFYKRFKKR